MRLPWAVVAAAASALRGFLRHRIKVPVSRAQSPMAELAFGAVAYGTLRAIAKSYFVAADSFGLRDEIFLEMAVARTYNNSIVPWIQTGIIALVVSVLLVKGTKMFVQSMKDWEERQEMKEMSQMGEDALFLMSTPIQAIPLEKKKKRAAKKSPLLLRPFSWTLDKSQLLRFAACIGYILPLLNGLDFGEISISLYPYALGVPPSEPVVLFMQNTLKLKYVYNAYIKSGYYFLIVWFMFIQFAVRNKAAPVFVRFHSSQAILMSMLLGVPQQVFFAVLNPWESGLMVQSFLFYAMTSLFGFTTIMVIWCCGNAVLKRKMNLPLVSEAAVMWAGRES